MNGLIRRAAGNWWVKVLAQNAIGYLPFDTGRKVNQWIVDRLQGPVETRSNAGEYRIMRSVKNFDLLATNTRFRFKDANVLELGTGWRGADCLLMRVFGAQRITTIDHQRWLTLDALRHSLALIEKNFHLIEPYANKHGSDPQEQLEQLLRASTRANSLDELLEAAGVRYLICHAESFTRLPIPSNSIDLFFSESVLQRIPTRQLASIIQHVAENLLKSESFVLHRTDQRDIHSLDHVGGRVWGLKYLQYSEFFFNTFLNGKFTSQNRLRESDFEALFAANNVRFTYVQSRLCPDDLERLRSQGVHKRLRSKTPEDIVTRASIFVGGRGLPPVTPVRETVLGTIREIEA